MKNWNLHIGSSKIAFINFQSMVFWNWIILLPYATAAFNWFPNEHSLESPHFLYIRCDPYLPHLAACLQPKLRYLVLDEGIINLDKLSHAYMLAALNTKEAHSKQGIENMMTYHSTKLVI